jgi:antitoxin component of RelBE/YafQ-DinJ toxin-antitoxin module
MTKPLNRHTVAARIDDATYEALNRMCADTGMSVSEIVREAVAEYLDKYSPVDLSGLTQEQYIRALRFIEGLYPITETKVTTEEWAEMNNVELATAKLYIPREIIGEWGKSADPGD